MKTIILSTILKALTPLFIGFALYMFFRGHDKPGGGFIAGLIASIPLMIHSMVFGYRETMRIYKMQPMLLAGIGLLLAMVSGLFSMFKGYPYLTASWAETEITAEVRKGDVKTAVKKLKHIHQCRSNFSPMIRWK